MILLNQKRSKTMKYFVITLCIFLFSNISFSEETSINYYTISGLNKASLQENDVPSHVAETVDMISGLKKVSMKDYTNGIKDFNRVIEINPKNAEAFFYRASSKYSLADYIGAIADFNMAIKIKPKYAEAFFYRALSKYSLADHTGAIADYNKVIELDPKIKNVYSARGDAKNDLQDYTGAIADYNKAIELDPKYFLNYFARAYAKNRLQDYTGAIIDFTKAINLNPSPKSQSVAECYYNRGVSKICLKDKFGALKDLSIAGEMGYTKAYGMIQKIQNDQ